MASQFPKLAAEHGYAMLGLVGTAFYGALSGMIYVGPTRYGIFGKKWAETNPGALALQKEHAAVSTDKFSASGYPCVARTGAHRAARARSLPRHAPARYAVRRSRRTRRYHRDYA
jgi:hypothetical protein